MARRKDIAQLNIQLTQDQHEALSEAAANQEKPIAVFVREIIAEHVPGFEPRKIIRRDPYKWEVRRKKPE